MRMVDENQDGHLSIEEFKNAIILAKQIKNKKGKEAGKEAGPTL